MDKTVTSGRSSRTKRRSILLEGFVVEQEETQKNRKRPRREDSDEEDDPAGHGDQPPGYSTNVGKNAKTKKVKKVTAANSESTR